MYQTYENGHDEEGAERQPDERIEHQFRPEKPAVIIVFDRFKVKENTQSRGDLFLPLAFRIDSVHRDYTEFVVRITVRQVRILLGMGVVFSKRRFESILICEIMASSCSK
jgi:hypothetical protein